MKSAVRSFKHTPVSATPNQPEKGHRADQSDDEPLRLVDDDAAPSSNQSGGSESNRRKQPGAAPRSSTGQSESNQQEISKSASDEADDQQATDIPSDEGTTGGFETMLGKLVVESGLVTPDEIELCNSLLRQASSESPPEGEARTLSDLMIENEFITRRQLDRMRGEFEAKKSSQRIPGYKIISKLGSGAMATVFLAKQLSLDRLVAIKILPKKFSDNKKFIERFYKEGRAAAQLNHPNIVGAYDVGHSGEHHYFVMEYVDGETVYDRLVSNKRIVEKDAIEMIRQTAAALKHAHDKGFIHRDIKPKNIMINKSGVVKLADLGLARAMTDVEAAKAEAGRAYGTPYYISPEQIRGEVDIGPPADIYGLGATFYHMVTGRVPFEGKNPSSVMHKHLKSELVPPDHLNPKLSAGCAQVIEMMMAKSKKARYQNASDLMTDLELIAEDQPPHFAHRGLSAAFTPAVKTEQSPPEPTIVKKDSGSRTEDPAFMTLLIFAIISALANAFFVAFMLIGN